jgi:hypothetical protein
MPDVSFVLRVRWTYPKIREKTRFQKLIQNAYTFSCTLYIQSARAVENGEAVHVGYEALLPVQVSPHNKEARRRARMRMNVPEFSD